MRFLLLILTIFLNLFSSNSYCQTFNYTLKQNLVHISECDNPKNGLKLIGKTKSEAAKGDSFFLDINKELFTWSDSKGTSKNKISNFQSRNTSLNTQYVFTTESNLVRITINPQKEAVIEIICSINEQWYCFSYLCNVR